MPVNKQLLTKILLSKEGYAPPSPMPGSPGMDPTMMDPTMMAAGMPPGGAPMGGGAPMDPMAAMGGAPMPPGGGMDPMAMGGMGGAPMPPGGAPMDPSMVGGLPPQGMPPMPGGGAPGGDPMAGMPIMLTAEDLQALVEQAAAGAASAEAPAEPEEEPSGRVTNKALLERVNGIEDMLGQLMSHFNIMPASEGGPLDMGGGEESQDQLAAMVSSPSLPESFTAPAPGEMPSPEFMDAGMSPMGLGPEAALKQASKQSQLSELLSKLNTYR